MNPQTNSGGKFPARHCEWCGGEIKILKSHCRSAYAALRFCSRSCIASSKHHKGTKKSDLPPKANKIMECLHCHRPLVRKPHEHLQAWDKRRFCNKVCAATGKVRPKVKPLAAKASEMKALHCRIIKKGSAEFIALQTMYRERDAKR